MELRELKTFIVLCEELHFSRAAARLRIAQSAVSYAIKNLEQELGCVLFERSKRRVALTAAGEHFRQQTLPALQALERAGEDAQRAGRGEAGRLRMRFTLLAALTAIPRAVVRFQRAHPDVEISLEPAGSAMQLELLQRGLCDIGFMPFKRDLAPLEVEAIVRSPLVAVLPAAHPLAKRPRVRLHELANERFVFLRQQDEPETRAFFFEDCQTAGFTPNVVMEIDQLEVLLAMVAAGLGVSCTPDLIRALRFPGVKMVPLSPVIRGGFCAVWDPRKLSPAGTNFLAVLRSEARQG